MKSYRKPGNTITITAAADLPSSHPHFVGDMFGVSQGAAKTGEPYDLLRVGEFELLSPTAIVATVGAKAYWKDDGAGVTTSATASKYIGKFTQPKANGELTAHVVLTD